MKRSFFPKVILYSSILFIINISVFSCIDKEEDTYSIFKAESAKYYHTVDYNLIYSLNESNKKNIDLSSITFNKTKDVKTLQLLLKIKRDHQNIDSKLKILTEKNLIIIPKLIYDWNINYDSSKGKNLPLFLSSLLEIEISNQIKLLNEIEKTFQDAEFKLFAKQSKEVLESNNDSLKELLSI